ncbi:MAG: MFS transporter [Theionarchaea archaeon]|nr:MFS transporter [Theionarchaea archaeon]
MVPEEEIPGIIEESRLTRTVKEGTRRLKGAFGNIFRVEALLLLFAIAMTLVAFGESFYGGFIANFLSESGIPREGIGVFFTAFFAASALIAIPAGYISDRIGRKIIVVFLFALAAVVFSYSLADTKAELLLLRAVHGAVTAFIFPVARAYVMDKTTEENRGQTMGTFILFTSLAGMMAPTFGGILRDQTGSFNPLFYTAAIFPVMTAIFLLIAVRDLGKGFAVQKMGLPTRELVGNRIFAVILVMFAMLFFASGILTPIMPIFAIEELEMSYTQLGFLSVPMGILYAISQFVAGTLSDRYGRKTLLVYPLIIYVVGIVVAGFSVNYLMFYGAYMLVGIGAAPYATVAYSIIGDVVKQEQRGVASGTVTTLSGTGYIFGPLLGSAIGGIVGLRIPFFLCGLMVVATIVMLFFALPKEKREVSK